MVSHIPERANALRPERDDSFVGRLRQPWRIDWRPPARPYFDRALTYRMRPPLRPARPKLDSRPLRGEPTARLNGTTQGELEVFLDRRDSLKPRSRRRWSDWR